MKAILVGLGSIGKTHLSVLSQLSLENLTVIDTDENKKELIKSFPGSVRFLSSIENISDNQNETLGVIANWGPDHHFYIQRMHELGVRRFIIEKPLVSRLDHLRQLKRLTHKGALEIYCSFPLNHTQLVSKIQNISTDEKMGGLVSVNVYGGAKCLVTNGIHYLALANALFNSQPNSVFAKVKNDRINPRNSRFVFAGGTANFFYSRGRNLSLSFSNESHNQLKIILEFSFGRFEIEGDTARVFLIPQYVKEKLTRPIDTSYPECSQNHSFSIQGDDPFLGMRNLYRSALGSEDSTFKRNGLSESEATIAMLISNERNRSVALPLSKVLSVKYGRRDWLIS